MAFGLMHQSPPSYQNLASLQARSIYRLHLVARVKFSDVTFLIYSDLALNTMSYEDLCQPLHGLPDFIDNREIINGSFISWVDNDLEFGPNCKDMSSSAKALSSSCNIKDVNPFAKDTKILRSPPKQSELQLQHQPDETLKESEIVESPVKVKVVSDTAPRKRIAFFNEIKFHKT